MSNIFFTKIIILITSKNICYHMELKKMFIKQFQLHAVQIRIPS